jgi:hypothetical protein
MQQSNAWPSRAYAVSALLSTGVLADENHRRGTSTTAVGLEFELKCRRAHGKQHMLVRSERNTSD